MTNNQVQGSRAKPIIAEAGELTYGTLNELIHAYNTMPAGDFRQRFPFFEPALAELWIGRWFIKTDAEAVAILFDRYARAIQCKDRKLIEVERDAEGRVLICTGCGTVETIASIKSRSATAFSCCPERKMVLAQGIDARSGETRQGLDPKDESPVVSEADDAPNLTLSSPTERTIAHDGIC